jgi:hypothetical protein
VAAQPGDSAAQHRFATSAHTKLAAHVHRDPLVCRPAHQGEGLRDLAIGEHVQERRLLKFHAQSLPECVVEDGVARLVIELGEHDAVLLGQRLVFARAVEDAARDQSGNQRKKNRDPNCQLLSSRAGFACGDPARACGRAPAVAVALQPLQVAAHVGGALVAQVAVFLQRLFDQSFDLRRNLRIDLRWRRGRAVQYCAANLAGTRALERQLCRHHFVQHGSQGEKVGAGVQVLGSHLLGRHIGYRAQHRSRGWSTLGHPNLRWFRRRCWILRPCRLLSPDRSRVSWRDHAA